MGSPGGRIVGNAEFESELFFVYLQFGYNSISRLPMKKPLFLLLMPVFTRACLQLRAQSFFRNLELELGPSVIVSAESQGAHVEATWNAMAELRYNFSRLPFDAGVHFGLGAFNREYRHPQAHDFDNHFKNLLLVGNYNFRRGRNVAPFVGIGAGWSHWKIDDWGPEAGMTTCDNRFCLMPRVGIEFFRVIRLSVDYKIIGHGFNNLQCSLGIVFGDWRRGHVR